LERSASGKAPLHPDPSGAEAALSQSLSADFNVAHNFFEVKGIIPRPRWKTLTSQSLSSPVLPSITLKETPVMCTSSHNLGVIGPKLLLFM